MENLTDYEIIKIKVLIEIEMKRQREMFNTSLKNYAENQFKEYELILEKVNNLFYK